MKKCRGFTLIEMVIMIAVGSILLVGLGHVAQVQLKTVIDNRDFLIALNLAQRQMAVMNNDAYPAVVAETEQAADAAFPDFIPTQEVTSVDTNGANSIRKIFVRVRSGSSSGPVLITLITYRTDLVSFGNGI